MTEIQTFNNKDLKLQLPFTLIVNGPSSSGKSTFLLKFITQAHELIHPPPKSILFCYGEYSTSIPILQKLGIPVYSGVPTEDIIRKLPKPALIILDDLLYSINEHYLSELTTKKSHHLNFGFVIVSQTLFEPKLKVARQNSMYFVLMRAPNNALAIRNLGVQLFPRQLDYFLEAYREATKEPYSFLFIDLHPSSDPILRLRTNIFKEDINPYTIFTSKNV
jgi:hypothetical protein